MKKFLVILVLILAPATLCNHAAASEKLILNYTAHDCEMSRIKLQDQKIKEVYGEIVSISPEKVELESVGEDHLYGISPLAKIYCNGLLSVWYALRGMRGRAYFEARILLDESGNAIFINAFYYGEPCVIDGWKNENGRIRLSVYIPGSGANGDFLLANGVRIPEDSDWLTEGQEIFVLYNYQYEIRAVFPPD